MKKYYGLAIEKGNSRAVQMLAEYENKMLIKNISDLTTYKNKSITNIQNECSICNGNTFQYMINTKCNNKYDHYYCIGCFESWYKNNILRCITCTNTLLLANFCLTIYQK